MAKLSAYGRTTKWRILLQGDGYAVTYAGMSDGRILSKMSSPGSNWKVLMTTTHEEEYKTNLLKAGGKLLMEAL